MSFKATLPAILMLNLTPEDSWEVTLRAHGRAPILSDFVKAKTYFRLEAQGLFIKSLLRIPIKCHYYFLSTCVNLSSLFVEKDTPTKLIFRKLHYL